MGFARPKFGIKRSCASRQFELGHHAHDGHEVEVIFLRIDFKLMLTNMTLSANQKSHFDIRAKKNQF